MGKVYLVGAGPGEKGLLTLKAYEILRKADVVVYDRLVGEDIMELIPESAVKIHVGKNVGNHAVPQDKINDILVEYGSQNGIVVRLKGGDPFVFGRGGEELEKLVENDIEFEVIPGITSSISAPMYGGIPVTHRDFCSSLHIITGHAKKGCELSIDFSSLVKLNGTLVFMMSVSSSKDIAKGLINAGMSENMPFAFIENATRSYQRKFVGKLNEIEEIIAKNNICSPAVFIVGKVCDLSESFDWFSKKTLLNKRILITQPKKNTSKLSDKLKENGAYVSLLPMIKTTDLSPLDIDLSDYDTVIFTSAVGVNSYFEDLFSKGKDVRSLHSKTFACIGTETANALKKYGIIADFIPSYFDGQTLANEMIEKKIVSKNSKVALLRAKDGTEQIVDIFVKNQINYTDFAVYKTEKLECEIDDIHLYDFVTFTSKSCVSGFKDNVKINDFSKIKAVCIGNQTEKMAKELGFTTFVSEMPTIDSMVEKILEICKDEV